ncbi:NAD(P)H-dependent oxidoreductase [Pseudonocardia yunnanensis]|uniref:FMN dependent NADH:quinone oxidoreductase n=1 Tax=Pseudonocardia yunnanensis TaxID=58107 RepID=A0ABW4F9V7_9PSEU
MRFFRLDSSLHVDGSVSRALADVVQQEWSRAYPAAGFIRRDLGCHPLPPVWPAAIAGRMTPEEARTGEQRSAGALAGRLVDELLESDAYIFAVPMYNFGVPQQVKHWIDLIITDPRADDVNRPLLPGRPAVLVEARGGGYGPGRGREGWDHVTPYLSRILGDVWGLDLAIASAELTVADTNPAMAHLRGLARRQRADAHAAARDHAISIARRLRTAA